MHEALEYIDRLRADLPRFDAERAGEWLYGAPALSMFDLLGDRETQLSAVYAELLDPKGAHGQGALFLNAFLRAVGLPEVRRDDINKVKVSTEASIREGRIDILIETPSALIAIENKPRANLQDRQLERYADHVCARKGDRTGALVFLSNWEAEPEEEDATE